MRFVVFEKAKTISSDGYDWQLDGWPHMDEKMGFLGQPESILGHMEPIQAMAV